MGHPKTNRQKKTAAASTIAGVLLLILGGGALDAQESARITGRVLEAGGGGPVTGALVTLLEAHRSYLTRQDGAFVIEEVTPGTYTLRVERPGYRGYHEEIELTTGEERSLTIRLEESPLDIAGVVVTATFDGTSGTEALRPTTSLSGRELERKLDLTLAETLAEEPGVASASMGPAPARPVIRGFSGDRILILEDGERVGDVSSTSPDHAVSTETSSADRVEVVRGPAALFYGSNALGGVVNVVREEIPRTAVSHTTGRIGVQAQSAYEGGSGSGELTVPIGKLQIRGEGSYTTTNDVRTPVGYLENSEIETVNTGFGGSWVSDWGHAGASFRYYTSEYGIPPDTVAGHPEGVTVDVERWAAKAESDIHRAGGIFEHIDLSGSFTDYNHREIEGDGAIGTRYDQQTAAAEIQTHHRGLGPFNSGGYGLRLQRQDYFSDNGRDLVDSEETEVSLYGLEEWSLGWFDFEVGARYDWLRVTPVVAEPIRGIDPRERTFSSLSASLAGLYEIDSGIRAGVSLSRSVRTPSSDELFSQGPHLAAYTFEVGNPELEPEIGYGADAFLRFDLPTVRAELVGFYSRISEYSFPENTGDQRGTLFVYRFVNTDARFTGAEGSLSWNPPAISHWVFQASASYVRASNLERNEPLPLVPPLKGRVSARHERESWFVEGGVVWAAEQDRVPARPELPPNSPGYCDEVAPGSLCRPVPGDFLPTDGYARLDLSGGYRWTRGPGIHSVTLKVDNVTDAEYRNHLSRIKELAPEPGIGVSLLYRVSF